MHLVDGGSLAAILGEASGGVLAVGVLWRVTRRPRTWTMSLLRKLDRGLDDVVGVPEVRHPLTGELLAAEIPGIGKRMASVERDLQTLIARDAAVDEAKQVAREAKQIAEDARAKLDEHIARCEPEAC